MPLSPIPRILALLALLPLAGPLLAAEYAGKIISIGDGDTMTLLVPDGASFEQIEVGPGKSTRRNR